MRTDDNLENHMVLNTPDAPWNQPDAPEETAAERIAREKAEATAKARTEFCDALVEVAEFLESHPDVPLPQAHLSQYFWNRESFLKAAAALAKGGKIEKSTDSVLDDYHVTRMFGPVSVRMSIGRRLVCRLVSPAVYDCSDSLLEAGKAFTEGGNL